MSPTPTFRHVPASTLFVSEPPPEYFGNAPNEANNPCWTNKNWLKSRFHTSFAEYRNGRNNIGVLRVCNDDLVQPARGFGTHPHRDAEIVTYIVSGSLTHKDSMGTSETLGPGSIQFMTAGRGIRHSEHNLDASSPLRFVQLWFTPRTSGLEPAYGGLPGDAAKRHNAWHVLAGDADDPASTAGVRINADATVRATEISAGAEVSFELKAGRMAYILALERRVTVSGPHGATDMGQHDAAEAVGPAELRFGAPPGGGGAHVLLIEMKKA